MLLGSPAEAILFGTTHLQETGQLNQAGHLVFCQKIQSDNLSPYTNISNTRFQIPVLWQFDLAELLASHVKLL